VDRSTLAGYPRVIIGRAALAGTSARRRRYSQVE